jgi:serine/threonine protein kinase
MADVYRAHDETLGRDVDEADTAGGSRRELELQALARLSHPNLITLFDGSVSDSASDGPAFLALELVEGPTLAAALSSGALPEPRVRQIGAQLADALAYIHERGMVHRVVKPANILLGTDSVGDPAAVRARLSAFGIVRLADERGGLAAPDQTVGTACYRAPEQARSAAVGPEAEVYALGLVLVEALTGSRGFEGPLHEVQVARLNGDPHIPADLPEPWPALLTTMTASDPACRPSAAQVAATLRSSPASDAVPILGAAVSPARFPGPDHRSPRTEPESEPAGHKLAGLAIAAALFVAIAAGAGWILVRPPGHATPQQGQRGTTTNTSYVPPTTAPPTHPRATTRPSTIATPSTGATATSNRGSHIASPAGAKTPSAASRGTLEVGQPQPVSGPG